MKRLFILFAIAFTVPQFLNAQKLEGLKDALESTGSSGGSNVGTGGNGGISIGNDNSFWFEFFLNLAWEPTWWLLYRGPNEPSPNYFGFNDYPYADGENGLYLPEEFNPDKRMSLQLIGNFLSDGGGVYGGFAQARFSPNRALTLDVNRMQLLEQLEDRTGLPAGTDHFAVTNFNLAYNRVHHPKFQLWWGGGLMLLNPGSDAVLYGSPSFNAGFTWFIKKPVSIHAETQMGFPDGVFANLGQARLQLHLKQFMVYGGYQGLRIGDQRLPCWAMGTGVWF